MHSDSYADVPTNTSGSVTFNGVRDVTTGVNETAFITIRRALKLRFIR